VFLPAELYVGISKVQAELEIGKSAAILLMINEGLHHGNFVRPEIYEVYRKRYETKLVSAVRPVATEPLTREQIEQKKKQDDLNNQFRRVSEQWSIHDPEWQAKWARFASEYKDTVPNAKRILDLFQNQQSEANGPR
jgi:hypothetical protein